MKTIQAMLIDLGKQLGYNVITATVHPENVASLSVLSKHLAVIKTVDYNGYTRSLMRADLGN